MWFVAKIKPNQIEIFKKSLKEKVIGNVELYYPKMMIESTNKYNKKSKVVNLLGSYVFCFNKDLGQTKLLSLKYLKGLNYFLSKSIINQTDIIAFVSFCKSFENKNGLLNSSFFLNLKPKKFKFMSGPLNSLFFNVLKVDKNKIIGELNNKTKIIIDKLRCYQFLNI